MINWSHWHNEPYLIGGLICLGWLFAILAGPLRDRLAPGAPYPRGHAFRFYTALVLFYLAVGSPLDQMGERFLFSAHMVQHAIIMYPVAILFLFGLPHWMVDPWLGHPALRTFGRVFGHPVVAGLIYVLTVSIWHAPVLYEWALQDKLVHILEHVMFFGASLFYWWTQCSPSRIFPRRAQPTQMLLQLGVVIGMTPLFAYITFSADILYPTYEFAPRLFSDLDPGNDQLLAGVIMKIGGMLAALGAVGVAFYQWYRHTESQPPKY